MAATELAIPGVAKQRSPQLVATKLEQLKGYYRLPGLLNLLPDLHWSQTKRALIPLLNPLVLHTTRRFNIVQNWLFIRFALPVPVPLSAKASKQKADQHHESHPPPEPTEDDELHHQRHEAEHRADAALVRKRLALDSLGSKRRTCSSKVSFAVRTPKVTVIH